MARRFQDERLVAAAAARDLAALRDALDAGADATGVVGEDAMEVACSPFVVPIRSLRFIPHPVSMPVVRMLVERGHAPVDRTGPPHGPSPLQLAALDCNFELTTYLLAHGATVDMPRNPATEAASGGVTVLHNVCRGHLTVDETRRRAMAYLLEANGADRFLVDASGRAPHDLMAGWEAGHAYATGRVQPAPAVPLPAVDHPAVAAALARVADAAVRVPSEYLVPLQAALKDLAAAVTADGPANPDAVRPADAALALVQLMAAGGLPLAVVAELAHAAAALLTGTDPTSAYYLVDDSPGALHTDPASAPAWAALADALQAPLWEALAAVHAYVRDLLALPFVRFVANEPPYPSNCLNVFGRGLARSAVSAVRRAHKDVHVAIAALTALESATVAAWVRTPAALRAFLRRHPDAGEAARIATYTVDSRLRVLLNALMDTPAIVLVPELSEAYAMRLDGVVRAQQLYRHLAALLPGVLERLHVPPLTQSENSDHVLFDLYPWQSLDRTSTAQWNRQFTYIPGVGIFAQPPDDLNKFALTGIFELGELVRLDGHLVLVLAGPEWRGPLGPDTLPDAGHVLWKSERPGLPATVDHVRQLSPEDVERWTTLALTRAPTSVVPAEAELAGISWGYFAKE